MSDSTHGTPVVAAPVRPAMTEAELLAFELAAALAECVTILMCIGVDYGDDTGTDPLPQSIAVLSAFNDWALAGAFTAGLETRGGGQAL